MVAAMRTRLGTSTGRTGGLAMHSRRPTLSRLPPWLATITIFAILSLGAPPASLDAVAAASVTASTTCTAWSSDVAPPATIRVLRTAGPAKGTVQEVPFRQYVNVVMAAEWSPGSPVEALKAGAVAVKEYGWYRAMHWRGGSADDGSCYDIVDSTNDQVYAPETRDTSPVLDEAVDVTWPISLRKSGQLFVTHYQAGASVDCGVDADGVWLYQISAARCAKSGMLAEAILQLYYGPNLEIVGTAASPSLTFARGPGAGAARAAFAVQPVVQVLSAAGVPVTSGSLATASVTLSLAANPTGATLRCTGGLTKAAVKGMATFAGCSVDLPGTGYALQATASRTTPAVSAAFDLTAPVPTLTLSTGAATIVWGSTLALTATLGPPPGGGVVKAQRVRIEGSTDGATWTTLGSATTDAKGVATFPYRPAANILFRAAFDATAELGPATGSVSRVMVRQRVLLQRSGGAASVKPGTALTFTATVRPARPGSPAGSVTFEVYRLVGGTWKLSLTRSVAPDPAGSAAMTVRFGTKGTWSVRASAQPTATNANSFWTDPLRFAVG